MLSWFIASMRILTCLMQVDNFSPTVAHLPAVASHIATELRTPDIMFLQEIQDNNGEKAGIVDANVTLSTLAVTIANTTGWTYNYTYINGIDNQDGGVPDGNIRPAYLYVYFESAGTSFSDIARQVQ